MPQPTAKLGWDEVEKVEFSKALKQPLLVQTPLQVVLETLFTRIQAQAAMFGDLQKRIERIEARDINGEELLGRIRCCEDALSAINHDKLSPFNQQEILQRLDDLEERVSTMPAEGVAGPSPAANKVPHTPSLSRRASMKSMQDLTLLMGGPVSSQAEARIEALEQKLAGVFNLGGKLMAVELMAAELGMDVPDLEYSPNAASPQPADEDESEDYSPPHRAQSVSFHPDASPTAHPASAKAQAILHGMNAGGKDSEAAGAGGAQQSSRPTSGAPGRLWPEKQDISAGDSSPGLARSTTGMRMAGVAAQIEELKAETESLKETIVELQSGLADAKSKTVEGDDALSLRVAVLEAAGVEMRENIMNEIAAVRKDTKREPEVSFADFSALNDKVEAATVEVTAATTGLAELKEQQITPLKEQVADIKDQFKKMTETREMDTLFHNRITKLEGAVGDIKNEVQLAVQDVLEDVARLSDLTVLEEAIDKCATATDLRQLAAQQASLAQSVSGMADWLAVRPDTADGVKGTGSSATRFKCLTCDREIRTQTGGTPPKDTKAKGTFLPKLDGMPGASGIPVGPGLNAGELRRQAEERAGGRRGSPLRDSEVEDYGQEHSSSSHRSRNSPGRVKSGGRTAVAVPSNSIMPKAVVGAHRTPVFI